MSIFSSKVEACWEPPPCEGDCCCDDDSCMGCCICDPEGEIGSPDDCNCTRETPSSPAQDEGQCKSWCRPQACQTCDGLGGCLNTCMSYRCESCDGSGNCKVCGDDPNLQCCGNGDCCPDNKICCPNPDSITQCCDPCSCQTCDGNGNCVVCKDDPNFVCRNGNCCCAPNGCGPCDGPDFPDNPAGCSDTSFLELCNAHDECYANCYSNKASCDSALLGDVTEIPPTGMLGKCIESSCAYRCSEAAYAYYGSIKNWGDSAYQAAQECACSD